MKKIILLLMMLCPFSASAESGLPYMKHLLNGREFVAPWGVGVDFLTMEQQYKIKSLEFQLPGVVIPDPSQLDVQNDLQHYDLKFDVWLTPFLNIFGILGRIDADTVVDLSNVPVPGLPFPLGKLNVEYDGTVYGAGFTLAYGGEHWFTTLTTVWTDASLSGDFDSSISSFTAQPRIGLIKDQWTFWLGGMYLDTEEDHSGSLALPGLGEIPFAVVLEGSSKWNTAVGVGHAFSPKATLYLELGFGDRDHTLFNFTYRF